MARTLATALAATFPGVAVLCQEWQQGFEAGVGQTRAYRETTPVTQLSLGTDDPAEGAQFLRVTLPGLDRLEGVRLEAEPLTGPGLARVTAQVRGKGEVWLCLHSRNGWLYAPKTVALTRAWQTVSLDKVLVAADRSLSINFLTREPQPDAVFEIDAVAVRMAESLVLADGPVGPWRLDAADFGAPNSTLATAAGALAGKVVTGRRHLAIEGMPFPRSARPVELAVRFRTGPEQETLRFYTRHGGLPQTLALVKVDPAAQEAWQWVRVGPFHVDEVGAGFSLSCTRDRNLDTEVAVDAVVLGTALPADAGALAATPRLLPDGPLCHVAAGAVPPLIDGDPNDPAWAGAVSASSFNRVRSQAPVEAQTEVRFRHDQTHLYMLVRAYEPLLEVARQRRHEFAAGVVTRDGEVYRDDCCVLLLDPRGDGTELFEFTVNALGTVADARCRAPGYWQTRDTAWSADVRAAGSIGDGYWIAEMAIPFADLGVPAPAPGDSWQAVIGRIAVARREQSAWNPVNRGIHDPAAFGTLRFGAALPGLGMDLPPTLQPGGNLLTLSIRPRDDRAPDAIVVFSGLASGAAPLWSEQTEAVSDSARQVQIPFTAPGGEVIAMHGVRLAADLRPLLFTGRVPRSIRSALATVQVTCDGPFELHLNGECVARHPGGRDIHFPMPLRNGANVVALRPEGGTAAARIVLPDSLPWGGTWLTGENTPDAVLAETADHGWPQAEPVAGAAPTPQGAVVGRPGRPTVLRHTLMWEATRIWPSPAPALHVAAGSAQQVTFIIPTVPKRPLPAWVISIAVPAGIEVLGASGYYGGRGGSQPVFRCEAAGDLDLPEGRHRVYRIAADGPVVWSAHHVFSVLQIFVQADPQVATAPPDGLALRYWTEAAGGARFEPSQRVPLLLLPPLRGSQPQHLVWQLWGSYFSAMDDQDMRLAMVKTMQAAGINDIVSGDRWASDQAPLHGIRNTMGCTFKAWSLNLEPHLREHPDDRLLDAAGKPSESLMCTTRLLGSGWQAVDTLLREKIAAVRPQTVDYDYEYPPFQGPHSCYCARCLAAFRERAGLPENTPLDPAGIRERHGDAWVDFMARRTAHLLLRFKESVHAAAPGTRFSVYSGYQTPENPAQYGINWEYIGELGACDHAGCGYGRPMPAVLDTVRALRGIPLVCGELINPYRTSEVTPLAPFTKAALLRRSLDATGGVLVYDRLPMDGRCWTAIAETTRLVAAFEDAFLKGERRELGNLPPDAVQAVHAPMGVLLCVLNSSSSLVEYRIPTPAEWGLGKAYYGGGAVAAGDEVVCRLPPGEAEVYVFNRSAQP